MKRLILAICLALAGWSGVGFAAHPAFAGTLCVGTGGGCFPTLQLALNAASNGDTIQIGKGTYAGGVTIDKSVTLMGAGAKATVISGGGPVLTIGHTGAPPEPTITITGVTVTGGINSSALTSFKPVGGGILVAPASTGTVCDPNTPDECLGATVTIIDSVITGNSAIAKTSASCGFPCTFSLPLGGGIANFGTMTLNNTTVSNNTVTDQVAPEPAFDTAYGGGIESTYVAALRLHNSIVSGNSVHVTTSTASPSGGGGGINADGQVTLDASTVSGNSVSLSTTSTDPNTGTVGIGGGIRLTSTVAATIHGSTITNNSLTVSGSGGFMFGAGGGMESEGSLVMTDSAISTNQVTVSSSDPNTDIFGVGGGIHVSGSATIRNTQVTGNGVTATGVGGGADVGANASAGGIDDDGSVVLRDSSVSNNHVTSSITSSTATTSNSFSDAGGMEIDGAATISNTRFTDNGATSTAPAAVANGGVSPNGGALAIGTTEPVTISDSIISGNSLRATTSTGVVMGLAGGGIFNATALTLRNTTVSNNTGVATGPSGSAQGGGIWNGSIGNGPAQLTLIDSAVTHNSLTASSGITVQGGGVFNDQGSSSSVTLTNSAITQNAPDQCFGC